MLNALKGFIGSKKAVATIVAVIGVITAGLNLDIPAETITIIVSALVGIYVHAQGQADTGKEAVKAKEVIANA